MKRKALEIRDIQDEEDIYDHLVIKQRQKLSHESNQKLASNVIAAYDDNDDEELVSMKLNEKVNLMNVKFISKSKRRTPKPEVDEYSQFTLQEEDEIRTVAQMIIDNFDTLRIYENLSIEPSSVKYAQFRLFIYSILYSQVKFFKIDDRDKTQFIEMFNNLSQVKEFDNNYEDKFVRGGYSRKIQAIKVDDEKLQKAIEAGLLVINRTMHPLETKISKGILKSLGIEPG